MKKRILSKKNVTEADIKENWKKIGINPTNGNVVLVKKNIVPQIEDMDYRAETIVIENYEWELFEYKHKDNVSIIGHLITDDPKDEHTAFGFSMRNGEEIWEFYLSEATYNKLKNKKESGSYINMEGLKKQILKKELLKN